MFYFLYRLLYDEIPSLSVLRVFSYITIRAGLAFLTAFAIFIVFGNFMIRKLRSKNYSDSVKEYVNDIHSKKEGTPTLGGIYIYIVVLISALLWGDIGNRYVLILLLGSTLSFAIGYLDDRKKLLSTKKGHGLAATVKFLMLLVSAGLIAVLIYLSPEFTPTLIVPVFKKAVVSLGAVYVPFIMLVLLASSNAVNITDGLDGLAASVSTISFLTLSLIAYLTGNFIYANYLNVPFIPGLGETAVYGSALVGAGLGFLWYNFYPAQVFMGDSGSLNIGFTLGMLCIMIKQEILFILIGGIFVLEALSVIIQVTGFQLFKKRPFKMAPIHHHFEKSNIPESKVVVRFIIVSIILSILSLVLIKVR